MVHFVGAGPGAPDLITRRGAALLADADCIIYAGSLVNPALLGLAKPGCTIYNSAEMTLEQETDWSVSQVEALADEVLEQDNIGAGPASGSYRTEGMVIVPCSMKTAAGIVSGYTDNLLLRAADVTIKEKRPLVLAARETPMSEIHLRNLYELSRLSNVWIVPPMMTFYQKPESIDDMVTHLAAKLLSPFGVEVKEYRRWKEC